MSTNPYRRKKTRCPGERPSCSTCTRLYQVCNYAGTSAQSDQRQPLGGQLDMVCLLMSSKERTDSDKEGRLAQLEEKMQLMLERAMYVNYNSIYIEHIGNHNTAHSLRFEVEHLNQTQGDRSVIRQHRNHRRTKCLELRHHQSKISLNKILIED